MACSRVGSLILWRVLGGWVFDFVACANYLLGCLGVDFQGHARVDLLSMQRQSAIILSFDIDLRFVYSEAFLPGIDPRGASSPRTLPFTDSPRSPTNKNFACK